MINLDRAKVSAINQSCSMIVNDILRSPVIQGYWMQGGIALHFNNR